MALTDGFSTAFVGAGAIALAAAIIAAVTLHGPRPVAGEDAGSLPAAERAGG